LITPELREYAETPDRFSYVPEGSSVRRYDDGWVCVLHGLGWASVSGLNVAAAEVATLRDRVKALIPAETPCMWWIGPSAQPGDIFERLQALGLREPRVGLLRALALTEAPDELPADIDVRLIESYDDFVAARELQWTAFDIPEARRAADRESMREDFEASARVQVPVGFLATLVGRPAAAAAAVPSDRGVFLIAGATAPWARGRGLYRALVRARWDYAAARGTPALITHADPETSYPILKRLGFEDVCEIRRLEEPDD
jgi:ribosomal protein S18 acetylase RimI-like enzyme